MSEEEDNALLGIDFVQTQGKAYVLEANPSPGWSAYHPYNGIHKEPFLMALLKELKMLNLLQFKKISIVIVCLVLLQYSLWSLFFCLQGQAINQALQKDGLFKQLIYILLMFLGVKLLVMGCDLFQKFISAYYKNLELKALWRQYFPGRIYNDISCKHNELKLLFFDYLPQLFDYKVALIKNRTTIIYIFIQVFAVFIYSRFYLGLLGLCIVFFLNFLSKNIFTEALASAEEMIKQSQLKILTWVDQYFQGYREISNNWPGIAKTSWKDTLYQDYYNAKKKQLLFYLHRDLANQLLVELPFLLNTALVLGGVYFNYLKLTQLFVWLGFSQFMINASNAYLENRVSKKQLLSLELKAEGILLTFKQQDISCPFEVNPSQPVETKVILRDGSTNYLSLSCGIYLIEGLNGSGKTTLMNFLLDYERKVHSFVNLNLDTFKQSIQPNHIRVIDRAAVVFENLEHFNEQVLGPYISKSEWWQNKVVRVFEKLMSQALATQWLEIFNALEAEYLKRANKLFSSGEKVLLSLLRFFVSWQPEVRFLFIDEADSFLDADKKELLVQTLRHLSAKLAIYFSSHDIALSVSLLPVNTAKVKAP